MRKWRGEGGPRKWQDKWKTYAYTYLVAVLEESQGEGGCGVKNKCDSFPPQKKNNLLRQENVCEYLGHSAMCFGLRTHT